MGVTSILAVILWCSPFSLAGARANPAHLSNAFLSSLSIDFEWYLLNLNRELVVKCLSQGTEVEEGRDKLGVSLVPLRGDREVHAQ